MARTPTPPGVHDADDLMKGSVEHVPAPSAADDEFFDYLRGALSDDEPLGPMPR